MMVSVSISPFGGSGSEYYLIALEEGLMTMLDNYVIVIWSVFLYFACPHFSDYIDFLTEAFPQTSGRQRKWRSKDGKHALHFTCKLCELFPC